MSTSSPYSKFGVASLVLCLGCNAISGIEEFRVGQAPDEDASDAAASADADRTDTRLGTSIDGAPEISSDSGVAPPIDDADSEVPSEVGADVDAAPTYKTVFVTSEAYTADLGGLAGADAKCQKLADAAKLGGTYKAWLSDSVTSAKTRLTHSTVPYRLADGTLVASDWIALTSGSLVHAIDVTEKGGKQTTASKDCGLVPGVWTNSGTAGDRSTKFSCENWTSTTAIDSTGEGVSVGRSDKSNSNWTGYCGYSYCSTNPAAGWTLAFALYCFEQ